MPDWTSHLTPEERDMLASLRFDDLRRSVKLPASRIQHYLHIIAVLRELVAEKDKALALEHGSESSVTEYSFKMHNRCYCEDGPQPHGCHNCDALRLTEDDMRKRLEE